MGARDCERLRPLAEMVRRRYGVPTIVTLGQALEESGCGISSLAQAGNNVFGIHGVAAGSTPCEAGGTSQCRTYRSLEDGFNDYGRILSTVSRYRGAFQYRTDPYKFITWIWGAGYATSSTYALNVVRRMRAIDPSLPEPPATLVSLWDRISSTPYNERPALLAQLGQVGSTYYASGLFAPPTWVWIASGILGLALIGGIVLYRRRGK